MDLPLANMQNNPRMGQNMNGSMENGMQPVNQSDDIPEPENILAHMTPEECLELDEMQGGVVIDPETGLRDYTMLEYLMQFPEYQAAMEEALFLSSKKKMAEGGRVEQGRPIAPELEDLRIAGRGKDTELVIITSGLADIFEQWSDGKIKTNPITGFPEYGFFKEFLRIAAPIVGAVFGGPIGAFAASTIANKATGKDWGNSLKQGLISGGLTLAAPMVGGAISSAFPGVASTLGGATTSALGPSLGGAVNGLFTPTAGAGLFGLGLGGGASAVVPAASVGHLLPGAAYGTAGLGGAGSLGAMGATQAAGAGTGILGGLGNLISKIGPTALPLAGAAILGMKGAKEDKKAQEEYYRRLEADRQKWGSAHGRDSVWNPPGPLLMTQNPEPISPEDLDVGREHEYFKYGPQRKYAEGGPVNGVGTGQSDQIPRDLRNHSYIVDASTVSDIGDGSTNAGYKKLNHYINNVKDMPLHQAKGGMIKALLSDGEYEISPEKVAGVGNGSPEKGAHILDEMVIRIREKKRNSGKNLPPKMKNFGGYLTSLAR